jgi:glycosyltransferase involved in cell wall biosynthesis
MRTATPIVVFSHLRWRSVFQRPQQIMTRLARRRDVLFVEEPVFESGPPGLEVTEVADGVRACRPHTALRESGFGARQNDSIAPLVLDLLRREEVKSFTAWMYTPMATSLATRLGPAAVVYDCMDDLAGFHGAPPELVAEERALLARADLVFTGGPSLYRARRERHPAVHCFPSSVDVAHFAPRPDRALPADMEALPRPRLGYFGVIDERLDLPLIAALAAAHPDWSVALIGPVAKIDPETLPRRDNLHYMGPREYVELPRYAAAWDVCLMPFALNRATRFISPTKSLEYMAAERPIVSTPITDVVEPYGAIVHIGDGVGGFVAACERALAEDAAGRETRARLAREVLARTSWDATVAQMDALIASLDPARGPRALEVAAPPTMVVRQGVQS